MFLRGMTKNFHDSLRIVFDVRLNSRSFNINHSMKKKGTELTAQTPMKKMKTNMTVAQTGMADPVHKKDQFLP